MLLHVNVQPALLTVQYQASNPLSEPLYLNHQLFDWYNLLNDPAHAPSQNRSATPTASLAYVGLTGADEVTLYAADIPLPPGVSVFAPRVPLATRLLPGETTTATLRLPLPLDEWHAYEPPEPARAGMVMVSTLRVSIRAVRHSVCTHVQAHPTFRGVWRVTGYPEDELTARVVANAPIPVRRRSDPIYRPL